MDKFTRWELRDRVEAAWHVAVTRAGRPVGELRPFRPNGLSAGALLERWHRMPTGGSAGLRGDVDW